MDGRRKYIFGIEYGLGVRTSVPRLFLTWVRVRVVLQPSGRFIRWRCLLNEDERSIFQFMLAIYNDTHTITAIVVSATSIFSKEI